MTRFHTFFFGKPWGAPALDNAVQVSTPVGRACLYCEEPILEGEQGLIRSYTHPEGKRWLTESVPVHRECELRHILGGINHLQQICSCYGGADPPDPPGLTKHEAAVAVAEYVRAHDLQ